MALTQAQYYTACHQILLHVMNDPDVQVEVLPRLLRFRRQGANQQDAVFTLLNELGIIGHQAKHILADANVDDQDTIEIPVTSVP